jgi:hypothetical protein
MTNDPSLMQIGTCNSLFHKFAATRSFTSVASNLSLLSKLLSAIAGRSAREPSATGVR